MKDITIVLAHRDIDTQTCTGCGKGFSLNAPAAPIGLWATIHSIEMDLRNSGLDYEFSVYTNGVSRRHPDTFNIMYYLGKTGRLVFNGHSEAAISPPSARQRCVDESTGRLLFFFDSHILVQPGYFKRAVEMMDKYSMDMLHSTTRFFSAEPDVYHYALHLQRNFWADGMTSPKDPENPYRIIAGGHGGFVVRRDVWNEVGGYWDGFRGYGGEEMYFDLKMAMFGKNNWLDPQLVHCHYAGGRGYPRHYTDDFFINMMMVANIIGGDKWLHIVQDSFSKNFPKMQTGRSIFDLSIEAFERSREHAAWVQSRAIKSLDSLLSCLDSEGIAH